MNRISHVASVATALALVASPWLAADARAEGAVIGPRLMIETDDGADAVLGVELRTQLARLGRNGALDLRPSFDYYIFDDGVNIDLFGLGFDGLFSFAVSPNTEVYGILGMSLFILSYETPVEDDTDTDVGMNVGFGVRFLTDANVQPFFELRATIGDIEPVLIGGGILFRL